MDDRRISFEEWKRETGDPLSDENIQALIDKLSDADRDKLVRLAAERLESEGVMDLKSATERWMGACYDIMRNMIENDMTLDEVE